MKNDCLKYDEDVDWLCLTVGVDQCFRISEEDGENLPNAGNVHIWGDFTGVVHRSLPERTIQLIADEGKSAGFENNHNLLGAGLGLEFQLNMGLYARIDFAQPLKEVNRGGGILSGTHSGDYRIHTSLRADF